MGFIEELKSRRLLAQVTHEPELTEFLNTGIRSAYVGYDPTADSLHVGHLLPTMTLRRWQKSGHRAVVILGGGTGLVGDPTGKTEMRKMLDAEQVEHNIQQFKKQIGQLVDLSSPSKGIVLNNAEWLGPLQYLPFLQDVGRHFSVNRMLTAESVKQRLEKGLTFLEFNYMLLQSYDFLHLYRSQDVTVQLGGDDQWSNMLGGVDLVRRIGGGKSFCITVPLLTTSDGRKMGKTEGGAIWLDPNKTSPFDFFQYWRNIDDDMVVKCLYYLTELELAEIKELEMLQGAEINQAKIRLATEITKLIHGEEEAKKAAESAVALFAGGAGDLNVPILTLGTEIFGEGMDVANFLVAAGIVPSKKEVARLIEQGGLAINDRKIEDMKIRLSLVDMEQGVFVKKGKKHYYRVVFSS